MRYIYELVKFIQQVEILVNKAIINISNIYQKIWSYVGKTRFVGDQSLTRLSKIANHICI